MSNTQCCAGDIVFHYGEASVAMLFTKSGLLQYTWGTEEATVRVEPGKYVAESSLWLAKWLYKGVLTALLDSQIVRLDASSFQSVVAQFELSMHHPLEYAQIYLKKINALAESEVNDLPSRFDGGEPGCAVGHVNGSSWMAAFGHTKSTKSPNPNSDETNEKEK